MKPKVIDGAQVNGPMLIELAESYCEALNEGRVPTIENAWNYVKSAEQEKALKSSKDIMD